jgi:hypothetical protein
MVEGRSVGMRLILTGSPAGPLVGPEKIVGQVGPVGPFSRLAGVIGWPEAEPEPGLGQGTLDCLEVGLKACLEVGLKIGPEAELIMSCPETGLKLSSES